MPAAVDVLTQPELQRLSLSRKLLNQERKGFSGRYFTQASRTVSV